MSMHDNASDDYSDPNSTGAFERPSKSQLKREATALQELGKKLVALSAAQLDKLALPAELQDAVLLAQSIHQRGARKRQLQYIGKLMRQIDPALIRAALEALESSSAAAKRLQHYLENLCAALVTGDTASLSEFLDRYPKADRHHLRQLMRNAASELEQGKPPKFRRALFRYLRQQVEQRES